MHLVARAGPASQRLFAKGAQRIVTGVYFRNGGDAVGPLEVLL